ncbi:MAG: HlyD family efflux transporter periplasmic adaptor subunit [Gemmataceae bacterium]|nr:HlyD family efflux transporter periplasmic adaptor subunit [Gemmataceae bacterium]
MNRNRWAAVLGTGALSLAITACDARLSGNPGTPVAAQDKSAAKAAINIGNPLFPPEEAPKSARPVVPTTAQADPIVVTGAQITLPYTENVPTKNNGVLWQACTEIRPGETVNPKDLWVSPTTKKQYRKLRIGDRVAAGDLVALLDDNIAQAKLNAAITDKAAGDDMLTAAITVAEKAKATFDVYRSLQAGGAGAKVEVYKAEQEWAAAVKQHAEAKGSRDKAIESLNIARVTVAEHELRASISGIIKTIYVQPGEAVKELSPVMLIQNLDTLRIEGMVGVQYLPWLPSARGKTAIVEPAAQLSPQLELIGHMSNVTGVAVTKDRAKPSIVSVSEDRTLRVWDRSTKFQKYMYSAETPIRAVATTSSKASTNLAIFGGDDGQPMLLDLDKLNDTDAVKKLSPRHRGKINSVAFSPNGQFAATADDKEVSLWDIGTGKQLYRIATEHRGPISSIQFTPQSRLVTVARDRTMKVWDLGETGAKRISTIDNRSGNVDVLGVSPDGQRVIFDSDRSLQVRGIYDGRTDAVLNAPSDSSQFSGFALFSTDASMVVAGGTADNPLSIYKLPTVAGGRGYLRVRLAVGNSAATCAALSGEGFLAVGTADHRVLIFARPDKADLEKQYLATITNLDQSVDSTDRKVRIMAEIPNPGMPLLPGDSTTLVIPPQ